MTQTTFDLSTLSDKTDGTHTVKVKAKADVYRDSEFSNEVSYTKAPAIQTFTGTITNTGRDKATYKIDNGAYNGIAAGKSVTLTARNDQIVRVDNDGGGDFCYLNSSTGIKVIESWQSHSSWFSFSPTANNFTVEIEAS